jgi:nucleotide-binding universal stress UspA family protein
MQEREDRSRKMPGIIVGVDGSGDSQHAVEWAMNEAAVRRAPLTVITVARPVAGHWGVAYYQEYQALVEEAQLVAADAVEKALAHLGDTEPASVTIQAVSGVAAEEILNAARNADMIVVGYRGTGRLSGRHPGSVSTQIAHHARCPVAVIPSEDRG